MAKLQELFELFRGRVGVDELPDLYSYVYTLSGGDVAKALAIGRF